MERRKQERRENQGGEKNFALAPFTHLPSLSSLPSFPSLYSLQATRNILEIAQALDRQPKVVAVTSSVSADVQQDCIACGMTGFISKPISLSALAKVLKDV